VRSNARFAYGATLDPGPTGLGGWLILPVIGLFYTALTAVRWITSSMIPDLRSGVWASLTTPGTRFYHPVWAPLLSFESICNVLLVVGSVILLVFMFQKRPFLPKLMVGFYLCAFLFIVIDSVVVLAAAPSVAPDAVIREQIGWTTGPILAQVARSALVFAIWIPYFLMSKRVKNTFRKRERLTPEMYGARGRWVSPVYVEDEVRDSAPAVADGQGRTGQDLPL
jgi:hypothetical protein